MTPQSVSTGNPVSHWLWDSLLKTHVNSVGLVDYEGFISDSTQLNKYLEILEQNHPDEKTWSKNEKLAFWINTYNAFTIRLIIRNYPCKSIKELGGKLYKINTPWDIKFIRIGKELYDLNNIEHSMIRRVFNDARVHFALNCASISCPVLAGEAFTPEKVDEQLSRQTRLFLMDTTRNRLSAEKASISKLFTWYKGDFEKDGTKFYEFISEHSSVKLTENTEIEFLDYDWALNTQ
jgi:hypothetical protein